jgi:membrane protease YdiL (CAAX protease family)
MEIFKIKNKRNLLEAIIGLAVFCIISYLSRFMEPLFGLVIVLGIVFPLIWAKVKKDWTSIGFHKKSIAKALIWGFGSGIIIFLYLVFDGFKSIPAFTDMLGLKLAVNVPIWIIIVAPFQEFFFRGWLQTKLQKSLNRWIGFIIASVVFTLWHYLPLFEGTATSNITIYSIAGFFTVLALGLLWGFVYIISDNNIIAPWISHAIAGIAVVIIGNWSALQYNI